MAGDVFINVGPERIFINMSEINFRRSIPIRDKMTKVKAKHSPYNKVPRHPKETGPDWTARYLEYLGKSAIRNETETDDEYLNRVLAPAGFEENLAYFKDALQAIAEEFNQGHKVTDEGFLDIDPDEYSKFMVRILKKCKYPTEEFEF